MQIPLTFSTSPSNMMIFLICINDDSKKIVPKCDESLFLLMLCNMKIKSGIDQCHT